MFDAEAKALTFLSEAGVVKIPFFQRRYVWKEENWSELYDNFFDSDIPGFLGSIILKGKKKRKVTDPSECSVIDGQQRLTTLSIFVMALYDSLNETDQKYYFTDLVNAIFRKDTKQDEKGNPLYIPRLVHSHLDKEDFDFVMNLNNLSKIKEKSTSLINNCYEYFYNKFNEENYEKRKTLLNALITTPIEILVVISISDDADEQKVFDTLNSAGVRLTMADTIKNNLYNRASLIIDGTEKNDFSEKVINLYNETWKKTFCETDELDAKWNEEFVTGRIKRTNIDMFLHCYATIKKLYNPDEKTLADLPAVYKKYINNINSEKEMQKFLNEMCSYAVLYNSKFISRIEGYKYSYSINNVLPRILLFEDALGTKTFNPYILYLLNKHETDDETLNKELHKIEKIIVLTYLNKNTSRSKNYNKLCVDFIEKSERINEEIDSLEDIDTGLCGLTKINNNEAKVLLFLIELYRRRNPKNDIHELEYKDSYQLEHIMPQKWQTHWNILPEKDDNGSNIETIEEKIKYRDQKIKFLGNMTILKDKLNNSISNSSFKNKIDGDEKNLGIRDFADFKITSEDVVNYYDQGGIWDETRINSRTQCLFDELKKALLY
jgi:uncharacterized protein with ParB-like and HNH nuclease domain